MFFISLTMILKWEIIIKCFSFQTQKFLQSKQISLQEWVIAYNVHLHIKSFDIILVIYWNSTVTSSCFVKCIWIMITLSVQYIFSYLVSENIWFFFQNILPPFHESLASSWSLLNWISEQILSFPEQLNQKYMLSFLPPPRKVQKLDMMRVLNVQKYCWKYARKQYYYLWPCKIKLSIK